MRTLVAAGEGLTNLPSLSSILSLSLYFPPSLTSPVIPLFFFFLARRDSVVNTQRTVTTAAFTLQAPRAESPYLF